VLERLDQKERVQIFDTFPFDGELDLLQFRLEETFEQVDAFVLVEAGQTYRGAPKPFLFEENEDRFAWARTKIRHVKLPTLGPGPGPRERAAVQRNAAMLALGDAAPGDVVLLLDVDEVPSPSFLERLRRDGLAEPRRLAMTRHYGAADLVAPRSPCCPVGADPFATAVPWLEPGGWQSLDLCWWGHSGVAAPYSRICAAGAFALRYGLPLGEPLPDAGRHYSSVDPAARLERKLGRVFHEEYDGPRERNPLHLARCREHGVHHRGWWYAERPHGPVPADVDRIMKAHPETAAAAPRTRLNRRLVRTWAWLRLWPALPDALVDAVDRDFERLRPLILLPLLLADLGRGAAARLLRLAGRRAPPAAEAHL
jgi:beta-1,4-mannosyl-glycoprotein beta-1,4-N-acetylglucosaminyltransferase